MNQLYYANTKEEFDALAFSIIEKAKAIYNDNIINDIYTIINKRRMNKGFASNYFVASKVASVENESNIRNENNANYDNSLTNESSDMFGNIGGKIKTLATVVTWLGIISSVIAGMAMLASGDTILAFIGIAIGVFGSVLSWVSSFVLYGFGQLIQNTDELVKNSKK